MLFEQKLNGMKLLSVLVVLMMIHQEQNTIEWIQYGDLFQNLRVDASPKFKYLSMVAKLVLCIPHSKAGEERVFNLIKLNKTPSRNSLNLNGTLSSIVQVKLANRCDPAAWDLPLNC